MNMKFGNAPYRVWVDLMTLLLLLHPPTILILTPHPLKPTNYDIHAVQTPPFSFKLDPLKERSGGKEGEKESEADARDATTLIVIKLKYKK